MVEPPRALLDCFWGKAPSAAAAELKAALAAGCGRVAESSLPRLALAEWGASRQRIPFSAGPRGRPLPTPLGSAPCPLCSPGGQAPADASRGRGSLPKGAETHAPETGPGSHQECRLDCSLDVCHLSFSLVLNPCQRGSVVLWRKEETSWIWTRCDFFCQGTHRITARATFQMTSFYQFLSSQCKRMQDDYGATNFLRSWVIKALWTKTQIPSFYTGIHH
ncbi:uncharacterized protein LOC101013172 [Papio anubis]|uniref:uncharacterized protein LOC101013172 n=1 Tax=Papio anubis TaxID=9555 RepID=UPI00083F0602|nr:uncharacterized protein LOC101013172 [Papio anubis]